MQTWLESRNAKLFAFESRKCAKIERMLVGYTKGTEFSVQMRIVSYANKGRSFECSLTRVSDRVAPGSARGGVSRDQMAWNSRVVAWKGSECFRKRQDLFGVV